MRVRSLKEFAGPGPGLHWKKLIVPALAWLFAAPVFAAEDESDKALAQACPGYHEYYESQASKHAQAERPLQRVILPQLQAQLLEWTKADQAAREPMMQVHATQNPLHAKQLIAHLVAVDAMNYRRIKDVIDTYSFPTREMVGGDGASAAWLLVQHQDAHPEFQVFALELMLPLAQRDEIDQSSFAMLTDRVLVAQHKPQRYGSQFQSSNNGPLVMAPTEELGHLDERRAAFDLPPITLYRCMLQQTYHTPVE
jgi:hypothetical protein